VGRTAGHRTFTSPAHAAGSDGTTVTYHEVTHFTFNADGTLAVSFDRPQPDLRLII
jgi:hypothetical protein